jgi:Arginine/serine-rich protein PNISR
MLTEVLLDVTNSEIAAIANSVFKSAKAKQAKGF